MIHILLAVLICYILLTTYLFRGFGIHSALMSGTPLDKYFWLLIGWPYFILKEKFFPDPEPENMATERIAFVVNMYKDIVKDDKTVEKYYDEI